MALYTHFRPEAQQKVPSAVKSLSPEIARKIAAGEVIDRPNAIVRELLDNAVDAGATEISVEIEGGGIDKIRIIDNGAGMTKEDMEHCAKPHATSKISTDTDLLRLYTLGFRGEALASIAAVSRLEITSIRILSDEGLPLQNPLAWKLEASTDEYRLSPTHLAKGTIVQASALFENFPARREFLKRPAAEGTMCRQTFLEKAMPCPQLGFTLSMDGKQRANLPAQQKLAERFVWTLDMANQIDLFYEVTGGTAYASFSVVLADPAIYKSDRKNLYIFINGRRIWEYSLQQAIEYGAQGFFPNGTYPIAALFLYLDPKLVDFNIHPAKKEARFKDLSEIHHQVSTTVRNFYKNLTKVQYRFENTYESESTVAEAPEAENPILRSLFETGSVSGHTPQPQLQPQHTASPSSQTSHRAAWFSDAAPSYGTRTPNTENRSIDAAQSWKEFVTIPEPFENTAAVPLKTVAQDSFNYLGTALGVFLIAEKNDTLYLIDQHASHERILFNRFLQNMGQKQALLFPYIIETERSAQDERLKALQGELEKAGFILAFKGEGRWEVTSVPIRWNGTEEDLAKDLLEKQIQPGELCYHLAATTACRAAVKDGTILDPQTARDLVEQTFALSDPHCPHGRPLWTEISKEELFRLVRRTE